MLCLRNGNEAASANRARPRETLRQEEFADLLIFAVFVRCVRSFPASMTWGGLAMILGVVSLFYAPIGCHGGFQNGLDTIVTNVSSGVYTDYSKVL